MKRKRRCTTDPQKKQKPERAAHTSSDDDHDDGENLFILCLPLASHCDNSRYESVRFTSPLSFYLLYSPLCVIYVTSSASIGRRRRRLVLIPSPSPLPPFLSEMLLSCRYVAARPFAQSLSITVVLMHVYLCHVDRVETK